MRSLIHPPAVASLIFTLWSLFIVALFVTAFVISSYLIMRLGVHVSSEGRSGVKEWAYETRQRFSRVSHSKGSDESEGSEGSTILINHDHQDGRDTKKMKVEEDTSEDQFH